MRWLTVRVALINLSPEQAEDALPWLQEDFDQCVHLRNPKLTWEPDNRRLVLETQIQDWDVDLVGEWVATDLWKFAWVTLRDPGEDAEVVILSVQ